MAIPGNLLSANAESIETDATAWTTGSGTFSRVTTRAHTGSASLQIVSAGSGDTHCYGAANLTGLTAGTTYTIYSWAYTTLTGIVGKTGCDWKNSSGTYISSSAHAGQTLAQNAWTQILLTATAPAGTTQATIYVPWVVATAANQTYQFDDLFFGVLVPYQGWGVLI